MLKDTLLPLLLALNTVLLVCIAFYPQFLPSQKTLYENFRVESAEKELRDKMDPLEPKHETKMDPQSSKSEASVKTKALVEMQVQSRPEEASDDNNTQKHVYQLNASHEIHDVVEDDVVNIKDPTVKYIYKVHTEGAKQGYLQDREGVDFFQTRCKNPELKCLMTANKDFFGKNTVDQFDALYFKLLHLKMDKDAATVIPEKRSPHQRFIMETIEAPRPDLRTPYVNSKYMSDHFFNWTWTYRKDSDIVQSYGYEVRTKSDGPPREWEFAQEQKLNSMEVNFADKTKMALWIASKCDAHNMRERYVQELSKYIDVDVYGKCGVETCDSEGKRDCLQKAVGDYKFYLAFENSNCYDYITEKFWGRITLPIISVVMGAGNYRRDAPPKSFIDVNDFPTIPDLANYLKFIADDEEAYMEYFSWRNVYQLYKIDPYCQLCHKLHNPDEPEKIYKNMTDWFYFYPDGNPICSDGSERKYFQNSIGGGSYSSRMEDKILEFT